MNNDQPTHAQFVYVICQNGAESVCKSELLDRYPQLRFAFSRPGLLTFKVVDKSTWPERLELVSTFARTYGYSMETINESSGAILLNRVVEQFRQMPGCRHIHVFQRDDFLPGDKNFEPGHSELAQQVSFELSNRLSSQPSELQDDHLILNGETNPGDRVLDIAIVEPDRWLIGWHVATTIPQRWPGGVPCIERRDDIISRAYYKMYEALLWAQLPLRQDDICVEIGSAPGGACQALIELGAQVIGIDPADMHPSLVDHPGLTHIKKRSKDVRKSELSDATWLMADMNVAPNYTLDAAEEIVTNQKVNILGMLLTLKIGDWKLAQTIPDLIQRVKRWGFRFVKTRQLAFNRREICLMALKNKATRRMG